MKNTITGRIIGNKPDGKIIVETLSQDIYVLDRFSIIRRLFNGTCLFEVPKKYKEDK